MDKNYIHEDVPGGVPLKMWTHGVPVEDEAKRQLTNAARLPIVFKHIAAMPDVHFGIGATVGSVIPTLRAIIPAAVGVDIGCGMIACKTTLTAEDLPDNLAPLRSATRSSVSSSFSRRAVGLSSITFAVLSSERVAAVSSRRRITLASADFAAWTTWARMVFISPGSTMSFTPALSSSRP